jgi:hypothetical protein
VIGDETRLSAGFVLGLLNWIILCLFVYLYKRKVDLVSNTYSLNKYEDRDIMTAEHSLMLEDLPTD